MWASASVFGRFGSSLDVVVVVTISSLKRARFAGGLVSVASSIVLTLSRTISSERSELEIGGTRVVNLK